MRAWLIALGTSDQAKAAGPYFFGQSAPLNIPTLGGGLLPDSNLTGLQGFSVRILPEPSTITLGILGGLLFLFWRRK